MSTPPGPLPDAVREALQRGSLFDAIKLLRKAGVSNLAEAKAVLEAEARRLNAAKGRGGATGAATTQRSSMPTGLPPGAQRALREGLKIEAIKLTREHTGLGLKEAKDLVEAYERTMPTTAESLSPESGLSPGEVPRGSGRFWWIVLVLAVAAGLVWHFWRRMADV